MTKKIPIIPHKNLTRQPNLEGNRLANWQIYWTESICLGSTESKSLHVDFPVPFYILTHSESALFSGICSNSSQPCWGRAEMEEGWVWGRHAKGKRSLKDLNRCKGNKESVPCLWNGQVRVRLQQSCFNSTANTKRMVSLQCSWQGELPLQEGMFLLSLHQIFQHWKTFQHSLISKQQV